MAHETENTSKGDKCVTRTLVFIFAVIVIAVWTGSVAFRDGRNVTHTNSANCTLNRGDTVIDKTEKATYSPVYALYVCKLPEAPSDADVGVAGDTRGVACADEWEARAIGGTYDAWSEAADEIAVYSAREDRNGYIPCWYRHVHDVKVVLDDPTAPRARNRTAEAFFFIAISILAVFALVIACCILRCYCVENR